MTLVDDNKKSPSLPSGKDVANAQCKIQELENRKETLRRQCNFFDSLLWEKSRALSELDDSDYERFLEHSQDYANLVDQSDRLLSLLGTKKDELRKVNDDLRDKTENIKEKKGQLSNIEKRLSDRKEKLEETVNNLENEKIQAIYERNVAVSEYNKAHEGIDKIREERDKHEREMKAEREAINKEKNEIAKQVRDLAIKHGRLQRVAASYGIKGV